MMNRLLRTLRVLGGGVVAMAAASCVHVSSDPVEFKPIHIVADINLRIDDKLNDFFAFEDKYRAASTQPTATQPAAQQVAMPTTAPR
jgi:hypothetical protein